MPTARTRSYDDRVTVGGTYENIPVGATTVRTVQVGKRGTCSDIVGNPTGVNVLDLTMRRCAFPGLDGVKVDPVNGNIVRIMTNFPIGYHLDSPDPRSKFPSLTTIEKSNLAWMLMSKANPSAPDVSVPTFLAELTQVPSLMKSWYRLFTKHTWLSRDRKKILSFGPQWAQILDRAPELIASGHLTWRWAVAPFIRDVMNLSNFVQTVGKRLKMLQELRERRSIRRTVQLRKDRQRVSTNRILHSEGILIRGTTHDVYTETVWGTVKYQLIVPTNAPLDHLTKLDPVALKGLATSLSYGLTSYEALSTAWELMPWSWLVDWFTGFGTVLTATNNTLGLFHKNASLMRHTTCDTTISIDPALSEDWAKPNSFYNTYFERKERFPGLPSLPFAPSYLPILTRKAGLILGSLYILRVRPRDPLASSLRRLLVRK